MKFNDGFWLLKEGVKAYYGLQVTQVKPEKDGYALQVATKPIRHRGDTLGGIVRIHSPTEGVVGVRIGHFKTFKPCPEIPLFPDAPAMPNFDLEKSESGYTLTTGGLTAEITENPYTVTFNSCLAQDFSSNPHPETPPQTVRYIHSELNTSPGELIYGLGEQFGAFVKNGQSVSIWNRDGGTSSEQAYKCVPFYMTNRGYGVFINHPGEVEVEVGSEKVSRVGVSVAGESLEYFLIYGETPLEILERYTRMTGRPALLPTWTFGLWLSTSFLTNYDTETVSGFLQGMQDRNCPVRVFHLDCFWMKQYEWCSFTFDPDNFPDPKAYLSDIKKRYGVKICVWINPYISQLSPTFQEGVEGGYFIKRKDGTPWQWDLWQPGLAIVDFTNPTAQKWYLDKLDSLINLGVDTFKTDFGERIPHAGVVYHDGSDPMRMHNYYATLYNELVFDLLKRRFGAGEAVVFARSAHAGGQRYGNHYKIAHWGGDCESTFEAMTETLRGGLSLTLSGFAFSSHDIGGFEGRPPPEVYRRWVAFGLFSSHSRLHGSHSYRVPWEYGEEAAQDMAKFVDTKHRLMPYLYNLAIQANQSGSPVQRAMFIEFLSDRTTHYLDRQYMFGPSLLVAPVFVPLGEELEYYLPAGLWTSFFHPERTIQGPAWVKEEMAIEEIPVWVRSGTILCLGPKNIGRPDYDLHKRLEVRLYELRDGQRAQCQVPSGKGAEIAGIVTATRNADEINVKLEGSADLAAISLYSKGYRVQGVDGGVAQGDDYIEVFDGKKEIVIRLKNV
ncbi:hypothetical protein GLOTRDRAFT_37153 [Gloeophyllum trabeum ATCC 11539]|uniref:alpha-D-xyloside xylohydrolase n=1 Tax=Gloeophyllum trabeum (strain ATCC 11539 / FP-39264 / Madison 617) TaxID=670483 RepID=S7QHK7_GLOTA|nr:uncharacterized protein GLOTRDRAFT_37153 [Gloeophyllum trabeum ATCC 11539]EPQ58728.1 hypothetical protein GLOTRDRAFT_37153 [Gloeophyllum trabeum ATCC 11539]